MILPRLRPSRAGASRWERKSISAEASRRLGWKPVLTSAAVASHRLHPSSAPPLWPAVHRLCRPQCRFNTPSAADRRDLSIRSGCLHRRLRTPSAACTVGWFHRRLVPPSACSTIGCLHRRLLADQVRVKAACSCLHRLGRETAIGHNLHRPRRSTCSTTSSRTDVVGEKFPEFRWSAPPKTRCSRYATFAGAETTGADHREKLPKPACRSLNAKSGSDHVYPAAFTTGR